MDVWQEFSPTHSHASQAVAIANDAWQRDPWQRGPKVCKVISPHMTWAQNFTHHKSGDTQTSASSRTGAAISSGYLDMENEK